MIIRQDIPYIRAVRSVPRDMRDRLPPELISLLDLVVSAQLCVRLRS